MQRNGRIVVVAVLGCNLAGGLGCDNTTVTGDRGEAAATSGAGGADAHASTAVTSAGPVGAGGGAVSPSPPRVLLFTKTLGYRHPSINAGVQGVGQAGFGRGWTVEHTEDAARFSAEGLAAYDVVVFLSTTGPVLDAAQQEALVGFVQAGGGFAGVHAASDCHYEWPWYGGLVGAYFRTHWGVVETRLVIEDGAHPATAHLGGEWLRTDEWYAFAENPRGSVNVLLALDEAHYAAQGAPPEVMMGGDHPIAWSHDYDGGRAFYTALGHTSESYTEPTFLAHVAGGVEWAAGLDEPLGR